MERKLKRKKWRIPDTTLEIAEDAVEGWNGGRLRIRGGGKE